jgi:predicted RNase H-like HicB family nuclease
MSLSYKILLKPEPEGGYTVNMPALPGCITYGADLEEAKRNAKEAIELYIESLKNTEKKSLLMKIFLNTICS